MAIAGYKLRLRVICGDYELKVAIESYNLSLRVLSLNGET